jgi:pimeloyl-ACP methyl ester carboxylesterase
MTVRFAEVNGVKIAYRIEGEGPPLVLVMGYRLNSMAWPAKFIEQLACRFTVIALDNRGTGLSDKPVKGYAIANMARDVCAVVDDLGLANVHMLGYSMGGAIAQEFVRQFPERVSSLILCATMAGGPRAQYAKAPVVATMRDLDGLSPEQAARRIWKVTYSPGYLAQHQALAEEQMRREIALPTPLHAADLQFQAFAEFDGSAALADIRCPTLILTGDLDELIPPQNSAMMARLIPGAKLVLMPGHGHRVLWEASADCAGLITRFLDPALGAVVATSDAFQEGRLPTTPDALTSAVELLATWPFALMKVGFESMAAMRQSLLVESGSRFGDGKPIILVPHAFSPTLALSSISGWLRALGYRPVTAPRFEGSASASSLSSVIHEATRRVGRKSVLITHSFGVPRVLQFVELHRERISDVVVIGGYQPVGIDGVRTHSVSAWSTFQTMFELPQLLRGIDLELIETFDVNGREGGLAPKLEGMTVKSQETSEDKNG